MQIAELYKAKRGFGGDNYYYWLSHRYEECNVACVCVGWGILGRATTVILFMRDKVTEDVLTERSYEREDYTCTPPEEALTMLGYKVVGEVIWSKNREKYIT